MTLATKPKNTRRMTRDEQEKLRQSESKIVKGVFRCYEPRGGSCTFSCKKFRGDPVFKKTMEDGKTYDVPLWVAKHINQDCNYYKHTHVLDADGKPTVDRGQKIQRFSFESLEFYADES